MTQRPVIKSVSGAGRRGREGGRHGQMIITLARGRCVFTHTGRRHVDPMCC